MARRIPSASAAMGLLASGYDKTLPLPQVGRV